MMGILELRPAARLLPATEERGAGCDGGGAAGHDVGGAPVLEGGRLPVVTAKGLPVASAGGLRILNMGWLPVVAAVRLLAVKAESPSDVTGGGCRLLMREACR